MGDWLLSEKGDEYRMGGRELAKFLPPPPLGRNPALWPMYVDRSLLIKKKCDYLFHTGINKLGLPPECKDRVQLVLSDDGTDIDEDEILKEFQGAVLLLLEPGQVWVPNGYVQTSSQLAEAVVDPRPSKSTKPLVVANSSRLTKSDVEPPPRPAKPSVVADPSRADEVQPLVVANSSRSTKCEVEPIPPLPAKPSVVADPSRADEVQQPSQLSPVIQPTSVAGPSRRQSHHLPSSGSCASPG